MKTALREQISRNLQLRSVFGFGHLSDVANDPSSSTLNHPISVMLLVGFKYLGSVLNHVPVADCGNLLADFVVDVEVDSEKTIFLTALQTKKALALSLDQIAAIDVIVAAELDAKLIRCGPHIIFLANAESIHPESKP